MFPCFDLTICFSNRCETEVDAFFFSLFQGFALDRVAFFFFFYDEDNRCEPSKNHLAPLATLVPRRVRFEEASPASPRQRLFIIVVETSPRDGRDLVAVPRADRIGPQGPRARPGSVRFASRGRTVESRTTVGHRREGTRTRRRLDREPRARDQSRRCRGDRGKRKRVGWESSRPVEQEVSISSTFVGWGICPLMFLTSPFQKKRHAFHILFSVPLPTATRGTSSSSSDLSTTTTATATAAGKRPGSSGLTLRSPGKSQAVAMPTVRHLEEFLDGELNRVLQQQQVT